MSDPATPTLAQIIRKAIDARQAGLHTWLPGRIESYDAATQRCSVQPLIQRGRLNGAGERVVERLPVIQDVPVTFVGSGDASITWPVNPGDLVKIDFCEASLDRFLGAGTGDEVDPGDERRHAMSDAIAVPGLRVSPLDSAMTASDAMVLGLKGGARIEIDMLVAAIGGRAGAQFALLGENVKATIGNANIVPGLTGLLGALATFATSCNASPDATLVSSANALLTAVQGISTSDWLAAIAKVK